MIILHGENTVLSRKNLELLKTQRKNQEVITFDGAKLTLEELKQALEAKSLFGLGKLVILENLLSLRKKSKEADSILGYLKDEPQETNLILWEGEEIKSSILRFFPFAEVRIFKPDPLLFRFLDTLQPGNNQRMIEAFRKSCFQEDASLIFYFLVRQLRFLLFFKSGSRKKLEEMGRLADWQKKKIERQAGYFPLKKLLKAYRELLAIDWREKAGLAPYPLKGALELFLSNL